MAALSAGYTGVPLSIGATHVDGMAVDPFKGQTLMPTPLAGRRPGTPDEIMLGSRTMGALHARLGSTVRVTLADSGTAVPYRVVGEGVFPSLSDTLGLGTGGSFVSPALVVGGVLLGSAAWWCILVVATSLLRARMTPAVVRGISTFSGLAIAVLGILAVISAFSG